MPSAGRMGEEGVCGYMKGFIDLVFETEGRYYIVDYKSNWLGMNLEDYHSTRLPAVITQAGYPLQYLLYTVAVHRYLRHRLASYDYDRDFGGVYYLFLRGMDARRGADYGIFYRRPERALVEALDRYFLTGAAAAGESVEELSVTAAEAAGRGLRVLGAASAELPARIPVLSIRRLGGAASRNWRPAPFEKERSSSL